MLLARGQGEDVAAAPVLVDRLADEPPRDLLEVLAVVAAGEEADARAAVLRGQAEGLPLADGDVGAERAGGLDQREGEGILGGGDDEGALLVGGLDQGAEIGDGAEEVGVADDDAGAWLR